jgi:CspA family cold shock protein
MTDASGRDDEIGYLTHEDVEAMVRFYDPQKGFGFVQVTDGSPDAFLPRAVLAEAGFPDVQAGDVIFCSIVTGRRDPTVHAVHHVDRNPFGKASVFASAIRGGQGGEAKVTRTDEPQRRWSRPPR